MSMRQSYADGIEARLARLEDQAHEVPLLEGRYLSTDAAVTALQNQAKVLAEHVQESRAFQAYQRAENAHMKRALERAAATPLALVAYFTATTAEASTTATIAATVGTLAVSLLYPDLARRLLARHPANLSNSTPPPGAVVTTEKQ